MNWFQRNFKTIIYTAFIVPILTVAIVSISHVTKWYGLSNPLSWAIYLSIGVEIAALSALAAISARMGKKVYFPFIIVTIIQFIGNIFFAYQYIDLNSSAFKDWVDLVDPVVTYLGVESGDLVSHKRFLALFAGGMLPIISLSFLHMLVKFEEEEKKKPIENKQILDIDELSIEAGKIEKEQGIDIPNITEESVAKIEKILKGIQQTKFENDIEQTTTTTTEESIIEETTTTTTTEEPIVEETTTTTTEEPIIEETTTTTTTEELIIEEPTTTTTTEELIVEETTTTTTTEQEEIFQVPVIEYEEPNFFEQQIVIEETTQKLEDPYIEVEEVIEETTTTTTTTIEEPLTTTTTTVIYSDDRGTKTLVYKKRDA